MEAAPKKASSLCESDRTNRPAGFAALLTRATWCRALCATVHVTHVSISAQVILEMQLRDPKLQQLGNSGPILILQVRKLELEFFDHYFIYSTGKHWNHCLKKYHFMLRPAHHYTIFEWGNSWSKQLHNPSKNAFLKNKNKSRQKYYFLERYGKYKFVNDVFSLCNHTCVGTSWGSMFMLSGLSGSLMGNHKLGFSLNVQLANYNQFTNRLMPGNKTNISWYWYLAMVSVLPYRLDTQICRALFSFDRGKLKIDFDNQKRLAPVN